MSVSTQTITAINSYHNQAQDLFKNYILSDPFIPYTSILTGIFLCKVVRSFGLGFAYLSQAWFLHYHVIYLLQVYDLVHFISNSHSKTYIILTKIQRIQWNNRGISTVHAIFISVVAMYYVFWSDLFSDRWHNDLVVFRSSPLSSFCLGVSVGYFLADLGMISWLYPSLGGLEYIVHHSLSGIAVAYSLFSGEGQLYTYMVLISEGTTPEINLRWYLDTADMKKSSAYLINGIVIFLGWLVARILLFIYMFYHVYLHYNQVIRMHIFGYLLVFIVPAALGVMNLIWFGKIVKGVKKTLAKRW